MVWGREALTKPRRKPGFVDVTHFVLVSLELLRLDALSLVFKTLVNSALSSGPLQMETVPEVKVRCSVKEFIQFVAAESVGQMVALSWNPERFHHERMLDGKSENLLYISVERRRCGGPFSKRETKGLVVRK